MIPQWWSDYVGGRSRPSFHSALEERFYDDPPSTMAARFTGDRVPDRAMPPQARLVWQAGFSTAFVAYSAVADWQCVHQVIRWWAGDVLRAARKMGIPLYVTRAQGFDPGEASFYGGAAFQLMHCRYPDMLLDDEWQVVDWLGRKTAPPNVAVQVNRGVCEAPSLVGMCGKPDALFPLRLTPSRLARRS